MADAFYGEIRMFPYNFAPQGWLLCDGKLYDLRQYQPLYALIGNTFGGVFSQNTFAVPDLRNQVVLGQGQGPGLSNYTMAQKAGQDQVTLTTTQGASHNHTVNAKISASGTAGMTGVAGANGASMLSRTSTSAGRIVRSYDTPPVAPSNLVALGVPMTPAYGSNGTVQPHENRMPYLAMGFFICAEGYWPPNPN